jgi:hypothetical protein
MIGYVHWLEMRGGLFAALCFSIFAATLNFSLAFSHEGLIEFVNHRGIFVAFFTAVMAGGDGLHGQVTLWRHPWHLHKLSLPVARRKLVVTRITATAVAAIIICTCVTAAFLGLAASQGTTIDMPSAVIAHLYSLSTAVSFTAALAALGVLKPLWFMLAALLLVAIALGNSAWIASSMLEGRVAWLSLAALVGVAAAGLAAAVIHTPRREVA